MRSVGFLCFNIKTGHRIIEVGESTMNADGLIQELCREIYQRPLSKVRDEVDYPNLTNPLHLVILLIDCDTEIDMNGMLGFLENPTGRHLKQTIQALQLIGASKSAALFEAVQDCMTKNRITWERLSSDLEGSAEYEISSFRQRHGEAIAAFTSEISRLTRQFSLFNRHRSREDAYAALCGYMDSRVNELRRETAKRKTQQ
jgi:Domain of unknown function (DUF4375)